MIYFPQDNNARVRSRKSSDPPHNQPVSFPEFDPGQSRGTPQGSRKSSLQHQHQFPRDSEKSQPSSRRSSVNTGRPPAAAAESSKSSRWGHNKKNCSVSCKRLGNNKYAIRSFILSSVNLHIDSFHYSTTESSMSLFGSSSIM